MPAFVAVCDLLHRRGVAGATALLGVDGTARGRRERARFFSRNAEVPMMVVAVGSGDRIGQVLPELGALLRRPLVTLERVQVCKRDGRLLAPPAPLPAADEHGMALWHKLMIFSSEAAQHGGQPVHRAMVRRLRSAGISGATTLRGIWGFHGDHPPHGDRVLQLGRHVPVVTIVIDTPERIATAFPIIDELTSSTGSSPARPSPPCGPPRVTGAGAARGWPPTISPADRPSPPASRAIVAIAACVKYVADARSRRRSMPWLVSRRSTSGPCARRTNGSWPGARTSWRRPTRTARSPSAGSYSRALRLAAGFAAAGVGPSEPAALLLDNSLDLVHTFTGLALGGMVEVPVNTAYKGRFLTHILNDSQAGVAVVEDGYLDRLAAIAGDLTSLHTIVVRGDPARAGTLAQRFRVMPFAELESAGSAAPAPADAGDLVAYMYTSGTTGLSKGVLISHAHAYTYASREDQDRPRAGRPHPGRRCRCSTWPASGTASTRPSSIRFRAGSSRAFRPAASGRRSASTASPSP